MFCCRIVLFLIVVMKQRSESVNWIFLPSSQKFLAHELYKGRMELYVPNEKSLYKTQKHVSISWLEVLTLLKIQESHFG